MIAHRIEATLDQAGTFLLNNVPFHAGEAVELSMLSQAVHVEHHKQYALRGALLRYDRPTDPIAQDEWDAAT